MEAVDISVGKEIVCALPSRYILQSCSLGEWVHTCEDLKALHNKDGGPKHEKATRQAVSFGYTPDRFICVAASFLFSTAHTGRKYG